MAIRNKLSDALELTVKLLSALRDLDLKLKLSSPPPILKQMCNTGASSVMAPFVSHTGHTGAVLPHRKKGERALAGIWSRLKGCACLSKGVFSSWLKRFCFKKNNLTLPNNIFFKARTAHRIVSLSLLKRRDPEIRLSRAITQTAELKFSLIALVLLSALII